MTNATSHSHVKIVIVSTHEPEERDPNTGGYIGNGKGDYGGKLASILEERGYDTCILTRHDWDKCQTSAEFIALMHEQAEEGQQLVFCGQAPLVARGEIRLPVDITPEELEAEGIVPFIIAHNYSRARPEWLGLLDPFIKRGSDCVVFTTSAEKDFAASKHPDADMDNCTVIPVGTNIPPIHSQPLANRTNDIVSFGQFRPNKGVEGVIKVAEALAEQQNPDSPKYDASLKDITIHLVGAPSDINILNEAISKAYGKTREYVDDMINIHAPHSVEVQFHTFAATHRPLLPVKFHIGKTPDEISAILGRARFAVQPFPDGFSDRRSSGAAALTHNLLCYSTIGDQTTPDLADAIIWDGIDTDIMEIETATGPLMLKTVDPKAVLNSISQQIRHFNQADVYQNIQRYNQTHSDDVIGDMLIGYIEKTLAHSPASKWRRDGFPALMIATNPEEVSEIYDELGPQLFGQYMATEAFNDELSAQVLLNKFLTHVFYITALSDEGGFLNICNALGALQSVKEDLSEIINDFRDISALELTEILLDPHKGLHRKLLIDLIYEAPLRIERTIEAPHAERNGDFYTLQDGHLPIMSAIAARVKASEILNNLLGNKGDHNIITLAATLKTKGIKNNPAILALQDLAENGIANQLLTSEGIGKALTHLSAINHGSEDFSLQEELITLSGYVDQAQKHTIRMREPHEMGQTLGRPSHAKLLQDPDAMKRALGATGGMFDQYDFDVPNNPYSAYKPDPLSLQKSNSNTERDTKARSRY